MGVFGFFLPKIEKNVDNVNIYLYVYTVNTLRGDTVSYTRHQHPDYGGIP